MADSRTRAFAGAWLALLVCAMAHGQTMPADKRVFASIAGTIASPAPSPMHMPTDVAIDSRGRIYVADGANDRVLRFAPDGALQETLGKPGGQALSKPVGLAVDPGDQLWIADSGHHRLVVLSADGLKSTTITPMKLDETSGPPRPTDVAITPDGRRAYIVDNHNHRILIRDNQSLKWTAMGEPGKALGQFEYPFMVCIGAEGYAYVTEAVGGRVQQISPTNRWAGQIGRWGVEPGRFYRPKGIAADERGRVFVSDSTLGVVQVFGPQGRFEGVLTDASGQPLRFEHPMGMSFDRQGRLYVVELKANRVAVVALSEGK